jgi:hypothetical protein
VIQDHIWWRNLESSALRYRAGIICAIYVHSVWNGEAVTHVDCVLLLSLRVLSWSLRHLAGTTTKPQTFTTSTPTTRSTARNIVTKANAVLQHAWLNSHTVTVSILWEIYFPDRLIARTYVRDLCSFTSMMWTPLMLALQDPNMSGF